MLDDIGSGPDNSTSARKGRRTIAVLLAIAVVTSGSSFALQSEQSSAQEAFRDPYAWPSLGELVERADTIVAGEVLDMRSAWTADRRSIFTTVTLRPDRRFKGGERSLIRFRIPGGTVGDIRLMVTHSASLAIGEQVLVFLAGDSGRLPLVVAGEAGKRNIRVGGDGKQTILPGFAVSEGGAGGISGINTLDDLAIAMPSLLAAAQSR
ncbi:MAG: hypothetical protein OXG44_19530 [Gammaproteobacteria bacterium]|nr:hypothetical protein [Gammaproteobacteria bacterium]